MHVLLFQKNSFHTIKEIPPCGITMQQSTTPMLNKHFLFHLLHKEINEKFTCEEIVRKWQSLVKIYKQEHSKAKNKPSSSGTKDIYISTWEFFPQLHFLNSICNDTDATVDSKMDQTEAKSRKRSRVAQRDERDDKKLKILA